jgi:tetratricopeptide (TPR) repeat protein
MQPFFLKANDAKVIEFEEKMARVKELLDENGGNFSDSALVMNKKAFELAIATGVDSLKMNAELSFAKIYFANGNYHLAIEYFFRVLEYLEIASDYKSPESKLKRLHYVLTNIGFSYLEMGMNDLAMSYFLRTSELIKEVETDNPRTFSVDQKALTLLNIGAAHLKLKQWEEAKIAFDEVGTLAPEISRNEIIVARLSNLGSIYKETGDYELALEQYLAVLAIARELDDLYYLASVLVNIADVFSLGNQQDKAIQYYDSAVHYAKQSSDWVTLIMAYQALGNIYARSENYKLAYEYSENARYLNDSIFDPEKNDFYFRLAQQYEFDIVLRDSQHEQEAGLRAERNRTYFFSLISVIFFLLLIIASLFIRGLKNKMKISLIEQENLDLNTRQLKQEKAEMQYELDSKNRTLTEKALFMIKNNELILKIAERLELLGKSIPDDSTGLLNSIISELTKDTGRHFWKEFETRFGEVHSKFFNRLNEAYPGLSPSEQKLAAFLRLNLSTKEISLITFQNPDSIKVARSRLRKKFDLIAEDNLVSFLSQF